jgi:hypothetical protein
VKITIVGVDPGDSTGVAIFDGAQLMHTFQGTPHDGLTLVKLILDRAGPDDEVTIGVERFTQGRRVAHSHQPVAQQVIGAVQHIVSECNQRRELNNVHTQVTLLQQGPADAWAVASNELLRKLGLWQTKKDVAQADAVDANMAVRHALLVMAKRHARLFDALLTDAGV